MEKAIFSGSAKLIILSQSVTGADIKAELYSAWKRWMTTGSNHKFEAAFRVVGGDPTVAGGFLGSTFFLTNGWRIRPYEGNHFLTVEGNIFVEGGGNPFVTTVDPYNVICNIERSNLVDFQVVSESSFRGSDRESLQGISSSVESTKAATTLVDTIGITNGFVDRIETDYSAPDDTFKNMLIVIPSGSLNVARRIRSYSQSNGTFFFDRSLLFTPLSGSTCTITTDYQPLLGGIR